MATVSFKMRAFDEGELALIDGNVRSLDLSSCSLNELPCAVRGLAVSLEVLNVTWNQLSNLPEWFGELHALKYFDCSFDRLESFRSAGNLFAATSCTRLVVDLKRPNRPSPLHVTSVVPDISIYRYIDNSISRYIFCLARLAAGFKLAV